MSSRLALAPVLETDERSGHDRRGNDRRTQQRAASRRFDPLFAATLVNQIATAEVAHTHGYYAPRRPRAGIAFNLSA